MNKQRLALALTLALPAVLGTSCGPRIAHKPLYPVRGQVLFEGRPANRALVVLHPLNDPSPEAVRPRGQVGEDGLFTLSTYGTKDGAPSGAYRVTVELWLSTGKGDEGPTSRLPAKYANPEKSGLTATVDTGPTELKPFLLKR
jgi:hypothetical protein